MLKKNFLLDYLETAYKLWFFENIEPGKISSLRKTFKEINQNLEKALRNVNTISNDTKYKKILLWLLVRAYLEVLLL